MQDRIKEHDGDIRQTLVKGLEMFQSCIVESNDNSMRHVGMPHVSLYPQSLFSGATKGPFTFFYVKNLFKFGIVKNRAIHGDNSPVSFGHGNLMKKIEMFQLFCYIAPRSLSYLGKYFTVHMYLRIGNVLGIARVPCYFPRIRLEIVRGT